MNIVIQNLRYIYCVYILSLMMVDRTSPAADQGWWPISYNGQMGRIQSFVYVEYILGTNGSHQGQSGVTKCTV